MLQLQRTLRAPTQHLLRVRDPSPAANTFDNPAATPLRRLLSACFSVLPWLLLWVLLQILRRLQQTVAELRLLQQTPIPRS
jgi:hypothetical protein